MKLFFLLLQTFCLKINASNKEFYINSMKRTDKEKIDISQTKIKQLINANSEKKNAKSIDIEFEIKKLTDNAFKIHVKVKFKKIQRQHTELLTVGYQSNSHKNTTFVSKLNNFLQNQTARIINHTIKKL